MAKLAHMRHIRHRVFDRLRRSKRFLAFLSDEADRLDGTGTPTAVTANNATNEFTLTTHGYVTGDGPVQLAGTAVPTGLSATTDYWVIVVDANTFQLAASKDLALAGTALTFTDNGTAVTVENFADAERIFEAMSSDPPPPTRAETVRGVTDIDNLNA